MKKLFTKSISCDNIPKYSTFYSDMGHSDLKPGKRRLLLKSRDIYVSCRKEGGSEYGIYRAEERDH